MEKVLQYLLEFKPEAKAWFDEQKQVAEDYAFFKEFSKRENLEKAEWQDFQKIGDHLNCFRSMGIAKGNALGRPNHAIERYRDSFIYLVYGEGSLPERVRKFRGDAQYRLGFFGDSTVSELVGYLFPEHFIFFNARDEFALKFLEIKPHFASGDDFVQRLNKVSEAIKPVASQYERTVGRQTALPVNLEVDQFFSWLYQNHSSDDADGPTETNYWVVGAEEGAARWSEFYKDGLVSIGWSSLGNLLNYGSEAEILKALKTKSQDKGNPTNNAKSCFYFAQKLKVGDGLFVKQGRTKLLGFGFVESEYSFDESRKSHKHVRKARWIRNGEFNLPKGTVLPVKTVTPVTDPKLLSTLKEAVGLDDKSDEPVRSSADGGMNHWWLNANPHIWDFAKVAIGERQTYTTHNERGNKRQKYKYFQQAKPGDLVVGYVTSPDREIIAICKITKGLHSHPEGESIEFEKIEQLTNPISLQELQRNPALKQSEPLINNQGSLFKLTAEEFGVIRALIDESNIPEEPELPPFTVSDALKSVFVSESHFQLMLDSLREKKNVILQGPPGVGKTFVAKRLAYALIGEVDSSRIGWIQFHQSYSYEDFIQGFRPTEEGHFELKNGVFFQFCRRAQRDSKQRPWIFVIDEINRGNMSKIFGELMMLIEPDKRGKDFAMPLTYSKTHEETFFVPQNVHLIGLMNTADRSLAMVDYALRRRFRFISLEPAFSSEKFRHFLLDQGTEGALVEKIVKRFTELNQQIADDQKNLGRGYQIGHSYFCAGEKILPDGNWYQRIIKWEIKPLLEEYWLDDETKVTSLVNLLLE